MRNLSFQLMELWNTKESGRSYAQRERKFDEAFYGWQLLSSFYVGYETWIETGGPSEI